MTTCLFTRSSLLRDHEDIRKFYQEQFQHILVDEYQDTNKIQADFIDALAAFHHQVMAVGDDAQSIYSWRGANFENVLTFPQRFPGTREIEISRPQRAGNLALAIIAANTRHQPALAAEAKPARSDLQDASRMASASRSAAEEIDLNEIAVLPRAFLDGIADEDDAAPDAILEAMKGSRRLRSIPDAFKPDHLADAGRAG